MVNRYLSEGQPENQTIKLDTTKTIKIKSINGKTLDLWTSRKVLNAFCQNIALNTKVIVRKILENQKSNKILVGFITDLKALKLCEIES